MILLIFASLLLLLLAWLLLAPMRLVIDSHRQQYYVQWQGIGQAQVLPTTDDLIIQLRFFFWKKNFYPLHPSTKEKKQKKEKKAKKKKRRFNFRKYKRKGLRLLRSFRVRTLKLNLDTDDYVHNSYLYPLFQLLSGHNRQLTINYNGETELQLIVENRLYRMLIAFLL